MPRKDFQQDLSRAATPGQFSHLSGIKGGDHEGSIAFSFISPLVNVKVDFQAIVSDLSDYPRNHDYFVFATSDNVPNTVTTVLGEAQPLFGGSSIQDLLSTISQIVDNAVCGRDSQTPENYDSYSGSEGDAIFDDGEMDWEEDSEDDISAPMKNESEIRAILRRDLRAVKNAGFKVGYMGAITGAIIVSVSCRVDKLGISADALQAWNVNPSEYLFLLIRYPLAYVDLKELLCKVGDLKNAFVQMHVGLCNSYKPNPENALRVFQGQAADKQSDNLSSEATDNNVKRLFIDKSLNALLNERFIAILHYRMKLGFSWTGAELYAHHYQGKSSTSHDELVDEYFEPDSWRSSAPGLLATDHMTQVNCDLSQISLPLLAIQFTLRHFVKCTEFCLVCHCRVRNSFEAVKPYVCSNSLCLYQYMALGMGPSLEYEIRSQPYVVDMLISLTYSRATSGQLDDFPTGLGLVVPGGAECTSKYRPNYANYYQTQSTYNQAQWPSSTPYTAEMDTVEMVLLISETIPLRVGDWIVIIDSSENKTGAKYQDPWHCRVVTTDASHYIQISYADGLLSEASKSSQCQRKPVKFFIYDKNFDQLTADQKREVIPMLLNTLPDIDSMNSFLGDDMEVPLSACSQISPAALDLLRWIVASNRSCIMHDNDDDPEHRVSGMEGYMQFRLVQGAPDREQKFTNAVRYNASAINPNHPTLFAWHGSPLHNWHSILREGLWFKEVRNGRVYGDGVYMSNNFLTSLGYSGGYSHGSQTWPRSKLGIKMAISLNEVVNAPQQFVSSNMHYVVEQLDWIQPRYLFVTSNDSTGCYNGPNTRPETGPLPSIVYNQDPKRLARGPKGKQLAIPASILGNRRSQKIEQCTVTQDKTRPSPAALPQAEREKRVPPRKANEWAITVPEDDNLSVATEFEDLDILLSETEDDIKQPSMQPEPKPKASSQTDFEPGTLKEESLSLLSPPSYATTPATKVLQHHLQATLKVQQREPLADLGWYVDPNLISTVYQWIVELHSFDPSLPLAKDLKNEKMKSVVLELRFPPAYPMAPPFVRVIRPRFLEWNSGGGGHVTAGGAMCMELLTNSGWLPTASIESVLLQVRMAITDMEPRPARLARGCRRMDYRVGEAVEAYKRACITHGWNIPEDIQRLSWT